MNLSYSLQSYLPDGRDVVMSGILDDARKNTGASLVLLLATHHQTQDAPVMAYSCDTPLQDGDHIGLPGHCQTLLSLTAVSAPLPGDEFTWPASLSDCQSSWIVLTRITDAQDYVTGTLLFVFSRKTLSAIESAYIDIARQRLSLDIQSRLARHPYADRLTEKVQLLDEIGLISKTGGWEYDVECGRITWTAETYRLFGVDETTDITVHRALANFPKDVRNDVRNALNATVEKGLPFSLELPFYDAAHNARWVKVTGRANVSADKVRRVYGSIQDITEQRRLSDTEHNYTTYLATILDNLNDAVLTMDEDGTVITANEAVDNIFGISADDLVGQDVTVLMPENEAKHHSTYVQNYLETGKANIIGYGRELVAKHSSGHTFPIELSLSEVTLDGQRRFVGIVRDITERKEATDHILKVAYYDDITSLPNMKSFEKDLRKLIEQAHSSNHDIYCCLLNLDNFSQYNLSFGKATGDYILQVIAGRLKRCLSSRFSIYRGVADQFIILHAEPVLETDKKVTDMLNSMEWSLYNDVLSEMTLHGHSHVITSSISSAHIHGSTASYEKVIGILEFGKKRAKAQGHGGRVSLERSAFEDYERHNYISQSFNRALTDNEFYLVLQPQFDGAGNIICSEALLRWNHSAIGAIGPGEFIPIAEESDAVVEIGYWVVNEACKLLHECRQQGVPTRIAVNISGRHIARADFSERLLETTRQWGVSPHELVMEITETTLVKSIDLVRKRIEKLSNLGFAFSIDDFGTGYSSLSYLKELPISELKIDRYFVDEINFSGEDVPIVDTIVEMASAMKIRTVAEGIENEIQMSYLKKRGCEIFQGFYLARPMAIEKWLELLKDQQGSDNTSTK
ncbi:putative bifunctional diguanylate cyclase/phosphodiesterase [Alteromonas antoniana]|uniref:putative bifunctional diguanylate cyclase/phosphodiesterase n=1 Tax=Alteromonas antoniana TaxID=2803813 RepID=UPI001C460633